jgi:hypothetical protein
MKISKVPQIQKAISSKMPKIKTVKDLRQFNFSKTQLAIFILVFACIGGYILIASHAAGSTANVFVASNGSDTGTNCKRFATAQANPDSGGTTLCKTFSKAYQLASCGDTVEAENGSYNYQEIDADGTKAGATCSSYVTIQAATGATVTVTKTGSPYGSCPSVTCTSVFIGNGCCGANGARYVELKDMTFAGDFEVVNTDHVKFTNVQGGGGYVHFVDTFTMSGGNYGPCQSPAVSPHTTACDSNLAFDGGSNFLIDGATIHDFTFADPDHFECIFLFGGDTITIQNSRFYNCHTYDIMIQHTGASASLSNIVIQNNWFGYTGGSGVPGTSRSSAINMESPSGILIRYNSFAGGQGVDHEAGTFSNARLIGNIFGVDGGGNCISGATYDYNVWLTASCGTNSKNVGGTMPFVNNTDGAAGDYHLNSGTYTFENWIAPTTADYSLATDKDSNARTAPRTAGANNFGAGGGGDTTPPTVSMTAPSGGATVSGSSVAVSANASDNVGIAGVQFKLDGSNLQAEDTSSPYSITWDSTSVSNGSHTLTSVARDAAGNTTTSSGVTVTVSNGGGGGGSSANVFVSINGSNSGSNCKRFVTAVTNPDASGTTLCNTFNKAYQLSRSGDVIDIESGSYPEQDILNNTNITAGPNVTIQPDAGANVNVTGRLSIGDDGGTGHAVGTGGSYITLLNLTATKQRVAAVNGATNVNFNNLTAGSFYFDGAQNATINGGDYGNCSNADAACEGGGAGAQSWIKDDGGTRTQNITIQDAKLHDMLYSSAGSGHFECVFVSGGTNITFQRNHFWNCEVYGIMMQASVNPINNIVVQNNWFGRVANEGLVLRGSAMDIESPTGALIRYNSFAAGEGIDQEAGSGSNVRIIANIFGVAGNAFVNNGGFPVCISGYTYDYNWWTGSSCGTHSNVLPGGILPYVNTSDSSSGNYHLTGTPTVIDSVPGTTSDQQLATDYDSQARPAGSSYDAGSDEAGAGACPSGDLNGDCHVTITDLSIMLSHYGQSATAAQGDINGDNTCNILDLSILLSHYGI